MSHTNKILANIIEWGRKRNIQELSPSILSTENDSYYLRIITIQTCQEIELIVTKEIYDSIDPEKTISITIQNEQEKI